MRLAPLQLWRILRVKGKVTIQEVPRRDIPKLEKAITMNKYREVRQAKSVGIDRYGHLKFTHLPVEGKPDVVTVVATVIDWNKLDDSI